MSHFDGVGLIAQHPPQAINNISVVKFKLCFKFIGILSLAPFTEPSNTIHNELMICI